MFNITHKGNAHQNHSEISEVAKYVEILAHSYTAGENRTTGLSTHLAVVPSKVFLRLAGVATDMQYNPAKQII